MNTQQQIELYRQLDAEYEQSTEGVRKPTRILDAVDEPSSDESPKRDWTQFWMVAGLGLGAWLLAFGLYCGFIAVMRALA